MGVREGEIKSGSFVASGTTLVLMLITEIRLREEGWRWIRNVLGCIDFEMFFRHCSDDVEVATVWKSERDPVWRYKLESC